MYIVTFRNTAPADGAVSCSEGTLTLVTMVTMAWLVHWLALAALLASVQGQHEGSGGDLAISMVEYIAPGDGDDDYIADGDDYSEDSAANRLIGEVVQSRRRPLLGPSPG